MKETEYFERFMRIRPLIVGNKKILGAMRYIVREELLDESPYFIGKGSSTVVYGLGKLEGFEERELFLAMRIWHAGIFDWKKPFGHSKSFVEGEVGAFEKAFYKYGPRSAVFRRTLMAPFFAGAFNWKNKEGKTLFGVLTQDLSSGGEKKVIEDEENERGFVISPGEMDKEYFMDPRTLHSEFGEKYGKRGKMISLGRV